jgi:hypothetical protein
MQSGWFASFLIRYRPQTLHVQGQASCAATCRARPIRIRLPLPRKPLALAFESFVDQQIREAQESGGVKDR